MAGRIKVTETAVCQICGKECKGGTGLSAHMRKHSSGKKLKKKTKKKVKAQLPVTCNLLRADITIEIDIAAAFNAGAVKVVK